MGGLLLHQQQPIVFVNRLDFSLNILLLSNIGNVILHNQPLQVTLDIIYILLPILLFISIRQKHRVQYALALVHALFNLFYALLITAVAPLSIQWFSGFMLVPLIFVLKNEQSFYLALNAMRYIFLMIFFSAGLWKIRAGGIFNLEQMSAILVRQHAQLLLDVQGSWYEQMIRFLIGRPGLSYSLYLVGTAAELTFVVGFFSKRFDRVLTAILILFIIFNFLFMKINYVSLLAFAGCLWFSNRGEQKAVAQPLNNFIPLA